MTVNELIQELKKHNRLARVIINDEEVVGVGMVGGRMREGVNPVFVRVPEHKAKEFAITFTHYEERSDGKQWLSSYW